MRKDIPDHKVEDLAIAIVPREGDELLEEEMWDSFLINLKDDTIKNVLISSKGYGEVDGENRKTTVLRHFFEEVGPSAYIPIEPIHTNLFNLTNEYWVSFVYEDYMYDKKYIFVQGSIDAGNFTDIPFLNRKGVMIR
ncbi:MAG: hypothetical protein JNK77_06485 [Saprospiraceae bacterium]|nr:hypothetical protein [Saprospiraceae bacterium]